MSDTGWNVTFGVICSWILIGLGYGAALLIAFAIIFEIVGGPEITNEFGLFLWGVGTVIAVFKVKDKNYFT